MRSSERTTEPLRQRIGECLACGYSLNGLGSDGACPECGKPFGEDEFRVQGFSSAMMVSRFGCALIVAGSAIVFGVLALLDRDVSAAGSAFALAAAIIVIGALLARRSHGGSLRPRPHLLVLRNELRLRIGGDDTLTLGWDDIRGITLYRVFAGWELLFTVGSLAFKPRFSFEADEVEARALLELLLKRLRERHVR